MKTADVSTVGLVLHFRTWQKTLTCLRSLHEAGINKVVVVDNSEDGGASIANMQGELAALRDEQFVIEILSPGKNLGFAAGVNYGLSHISSQNHVCNVLLINSDAYLVGAALDKMKAALTSAAIVAPMISQKEQPVSSPVAYYDRLLGLITASPKLLPLRHISGCCLLIHQDLVRDALFDEAFFFYGEDVMLGYDTRHQGIIVRVCYGAHIAHATSTSSKNGSLFYEYHINRAHWLLAKKLSRSNFQKYLFIALRCLMLPLRATLRAARFRSLTAWKGLVIATSDVLRGRVRSFTPPSD